MARRIMFIALSVIFVLATGWCALWILSSASLACQACDCSYSLFHEIPRCRQPYYAMIGAGASALAAVACIVLAIRRWGESKDNAT